MDYSRDEVRRQLAESRLDHADAMPRFSEALKRLFDGDAGASGASGEVKAGLLGLPSRRSFLTVGGLTIAGSALLVGCGNSPKRYVAQTGSIPTAPSSTTTTTPGSPENDLTLLRTAQSIEVLAINTYQAAIDSALIKDSAVADAAKLFQSQHRDHAGLLARATKDAGGEPYTTANPYLDVSVVQPAIKALTDQTSVLKLAATLEDTAAQTYTLAGGVLTTADLRAALMSIGATEARHLTVLYAVQQLPPVPLPFMPSRDAVKPDAYIGKDGPVKTPPTTVPA